MPKRDKKEKRPTAKIDFKPYGAAIKAGRTKQKESRNKAADALFISPRYLANIENKGQHPSVQVFLELMSRYHISVDQILHGETMDYTSLEEVIGDAKFGKQKRVDPNGELIRAAKAIGVCFGDE